VNCIIINRNGDEIAVFLCNENRERLELGQHEITFLTGVIKHDMPQILGKNIASLNLANIGLLASIIFRKCVLRKCTTAEQQKLLKGTYALTTDYDSFCPKMAEITYKGRALCFDVSTISQTEIALLISEIYLMNQYNVSEEDIKDKVVVDAGAHIGSFAIQCAALGAKKVYAFEPVPEIYETLKKNIELNNFQEIIQPLNKAVGDANSTAEVSYNYAGDSSASLSLKPDARFRQKIDVIRLDDFLKDEKIDFIKMDIEGYEEKALIGAGNLIKKYKPTMSISAYHKPTDMKRLPEQIKSLRSDYKIELHRYWESDFFCK